MEENNNKKAIQELKKFIEQLNEKKKENIFDREPVLNETLEKIEQLENEEISKEQILKK